VLHNYLAAALRNLARNKLYGAIKIIGLGVGFAAALLIALYVREELGFERFIPGAEHVFDLYTVFDEPERKPLVIDSTTGDLVAALKLDHPEVVVTQLAATPTGVKLQRGQLSSMERLYWADPNVFSVLKLPMLAGSPSDALKRPDGLVLTRRLARKYFGSDAPLGETIEIVDGFHEPHPMTVTAVLADFPSSTSLVAEVFASGNASISGMDRIDAPQPGFGLNDQILVGIESPAALEALRRDLPAFLKRHKPGESVDAGKIRLELHSLPSVHLLPSENSSFRPPSDPTIVYAIGTIGLLILTIAGINFVNLTTARAAQRAMEVGIRKVAGAGRRTLIVQYLTESLLYAVFAMVLAVAITELVLPGFSAFVDRTMTFHYWRDPALMSGIVAATVTIGVLAGAYPAFVLSAFRPGSILRQQAVGVGSPALRQMLVVAQFVILIALLIGTVVMYRQTRFALNEGLRVDKDQVLLLLPPPTEPANGVRYVTYVDSLKRLPGVRATTAASGLAYSLGYYQSPIVKRDGSAVSIYHSSVDFGFFGFYGIKPLAGRVFSRAYGADAAAAGGPWHPPIVLNERAARLLGFSSPEAAIGQSVLLSQLHPGPIERSEIIGVVPDFTFRSLREPINPTLYYVEPGENGIFGARLRGEDLPETLGAIDALGKRIFGGSLPPFRFFLDERLRALYAEVTRQSEIVALFAALAVVLACLGLLGLSAFTTERRTREIGIRKAMGAETPDILRLLVTQFLKPVVLAAVIACPIGAVVMRRWLAGFAAHINLDPATFALAAALAAVIALATVAGHSLRVARAKPALALRYE
jgi:putative ABC transport system permease protein